MNRLQNIFNHGKVLIIFDVCGVENSMERLEVIINNGADIVELGVPFSDPVADGTVIQEAAQRALALGADLEGILDTAQQLRQRHPETGLIVFGYYNIFLQFGLEKLFARLAELEIDGILIVDLPYEEQEEVRDFSARYAIPLIQLIGPATDLERAKMLTGNAEGFVYCINAKGVTGVRSEMPEELIERLKELRKISPVPVASGFGIANGERCRQLAAHADGVIVGSAAVEQPLNNLGNFIKELKNALQK